MPKRRPKKKDRRRTLNLKNVNLKPRRRMPNPKPAKKGRRNLKPET
jgi:hypothetical protein